MINSRFPRNIYGQKQKVKIYKFVALGLRLVALEDWKFISFPALINQFTTMALECLQLMNTRQWSKLFSTAQAMKYFGKTQTNIHNEVWLPKSNDKCFRMRTNQIKTTAEMNCFASPLVYQFRMKTLMTAVLIPLNIYLQRKIDFFHRCQIL